MSIDLGCYGMPAVKTPVLDDLAATGIQFMNCYGTNSICSPSRSNMITGVHQNITNTQHHRSNRSVPLKAPYQPITKYLRDAGYTCILGSKLVKGGVRRLMLTSNTKLLVLGMETPRLDSLIKQTPSLLKTNPFCTSDPYSDTSWRLVESNS